jgi:endoglucanase
MSRSSLAASYTHLRRQLSEFGVTQVSPTSAENGYFNCVVSYTAGNDMDWAIWALQGDYYVRSGQTNVDESFGILKNDWSDWRNSTIAAAMAPMFKQTQGP